MPWWWPFGQNRVAKRETISGIVLRGDIYNYASLSDAPVVPRIAWAPEALHPDRSPLAWLTWNARLTDLIGCDDEKAELLRWARSGGGVGVRFLVGEAGTGKTRLAHEVAEELAQDPGWAAGLVPADRPLPLDAGRAGCLLLVDYPEEHHEAVHERLRELARAKADDDRPVRVLFLSRHGPEVWDSVLQDTGAHLRATSPLLLAERLDPADAWAIFRSALARVPRVPGAAAPQTVKEAAFRDWLDRVPLNHRPLLIAAAAIQAVADPTRTVLDLTAADVVDALTDREATRLRRLAKGHGFADHALCRLAALAAVRGELDGPLLRRLADPDLGIGLGTKDGLLDRLRATGLLVQGMFPAPQPDIAAAALIVQTLAPCAAAAPEWLWTVVEAAPKEVIGRLERLTYDAEVVLGHHAVGFGRWLAAMIDGRPERAAVVEEYLRVAKLPPGLQSLAIAANRQLLAAATDDEPRAMYANILSVHLAEAGDRAGALAAVAEAVGLYRRLAAAAPGRYEGDLAGALINLSVHLAVSGDRAVAREAVAEAVAVLRRLAAAAPGRYEGDLAGGLINLSTELAAAGDGVGALAAVAEAVAVLRRLTAAAPGRYEGNLADGLINLSVRLGEAGDRAEALAAVAEAVAVLRRLTAAAPGRYEGDLAGGLNTLSTELVAAGDGAGALAAVAEAVAIRRRLAAAVPGRYEGDLASGLNNLSLCLVAAGDRAGAHMAVREAVAIRRGLAAANPARYQPDLAGSLATNAELLFVSGDRVAALAAIDEAIQLIEPAARAFPESAHARWLRQMQDMRARLAGEPPTAETDLPPDFDLLELAFLLVLDNRAPPSLLQRIDGEAIAVALDRARKELGGGLAIDEVFVRLRERYGAPQPDALWHAWTRESQADAVRQARRHLGRTQRVSRNPVTTAAERPEWRE